VTGLAVASALVYDAVTEGDADHGSDGLALAFANAAAVDDHGGCRFVVDHHGGQAARWSMRPPLADAVPPYESSPSFPSGHALNSTVIAGIVGYLMLRRL
jgi:membrane-associated phospholipid phosphatase